MASGFIINYKDYLGYEVTTENQGQALKDAAQRGYSGVVLFLLKSEHSIQDDDFYQAFYYAAGKGYLDIVKFMMDQKSDFLPRELGCALSNAADQKRTDVVKLIINSGKGVSSDLYGLALHNLMYANHQSPSDDLINTMKLLVQDEGLGMIPLDDLESDLIDMADDRNTGEVIEMILNSRWDFSPKTLGRALRNAAGEGYVWTVMVILKSGLPIDQYWLGRALVFASLGGHSGIVQLILNSKQEISNSDIAEAITDAAKNDHLAVVKVFSQVNFCQKMAQRQMAQESGF